MERLQLLDLGDNALSLELKSLRSSLAHYQHAADGAGIQLQRRSYDVTVALDRQKQLETENARLVRELALLSQNPDTAPHPAAMSASELTLALRRSSERLEMTESLLLERTTELEHATRRANNSMAYAERCRGVVDSCKLEEQKAQSRVRSLELELRTAQEERDLANLAVAEYAAQAQRADSSRSENAEIAMLRTDSMHSLDSSGPPSPEPSNLLESGRAGLQKLLEEFNHRSEALQTELANVHLELAESERQLSIEARSSEEDRTKLALSRVELDQYKIDDKAASKLVSRYMKFSQTSIDMLQSAIETQKTRYDARITTLEGQLSTLYGQIDVSLTQTSRLRALLDELTEDISRETQGRRREVIMRMKVVEREEQTALALRSLVELLEEICQLPKGEGNYEALTRILRDANALLFSLERLVTSESVGGGSHSDHTLGGSLARFVSCRETSVALVDELQRETEKRLKLERKLGDLAVCTHVRAPEIELVTPSDLGIGESRETLVDHPIIVHPISPFDQARSNRLVDYDPATPQNPVSRNPGLDTLGPRPETLPILLTISPHEKAAGKLSDATLTASGPSGGVGAPAGVSPNHPLIAPNLSGLIPGNVQEFMEPSHENPDTYPNDGEFLRHSFQAIQERYSPVKLSLRQCQDALSEMKRISGNKEASDTHLPGEHDLHIARLIDFLEDTLVEVEIRIADEKRIAQGYETLLAMNGTPEYHSVVQESQAFVSGADDRVAHTMEKLQRKAEDLEHDVRLLRSSLEGELPTLTSTTSHDDGGPLGSWSLSDLVSLNRSRPSSPAPTFGAVISSRTTNDQEDLASASRSSTPGADASRLPFRISMPVTIQKPASLAPSHSSHSSLYARTRSLSSSTVGGFSGGRRLSTGLGFGVGSTRVSLKSMSRNSPSTDDKRQETSAPGGASELGALNVRQYSDTQTAGDGVE